MAVLNRIFHRLLSWFSIAVFVVLVVDVVLGIISRWVFGSRMAWLVSVGESVMGEPLRWTGELATFLLVWLVFCGAAIAYYDKAHLGINLLIEKLEPTARRMMRVLSHLVVLVFVVGVMVWGGGQLVAERFDSGQMMSTLGIAKAWQYLSIPFSGVFVALFNIGMMIETLKEDVTVEGNVEK
ncbi:MAG: TRAP transporter small permease [Verrucomicrobiales bacterium]|nr:TRAP transporter small permease subunit [Verrucomicrobiota bacterium JB025]